MGRKVDGARIFRTVAGWRQPGRGFQSEFVLLEDRAQTPRFDPGQRAGTTGWFGLSFAMGSLLSRNILAGLDHLMFLLALWR